MNKQLIIFAMMLLTMKASAYSGNAEIGGLWYLIVTKANEAKVIKCQNGKYSGEIVIPETVEYEGIVCDVKAIDREAFSGCTEPLSIAIPSSMNSIADYTFNGCTGLTSIVIPSSVTSIGQYAFQKCTGLTTITIPSSVTSIGSSAFQNCSGLTTITIPSSVTSIGSAAFAYCTSMTSVTIPTSMTSVVDNLFIGCSSLTSVTIPSSVTCIGYYAFMNCIGLTSVTIPNSVTNVWGGAFSGCKALTTVFIGSAVNSVDAKAFANCPELTHVYCYAEKVPSAYYDTFSGSYIDYATLHVPTASIEKYKKQSPWSSFRNIVGLNGSSPDTPKCATPTITFVDGKVMFDCETEGVEYAYEITNADVKKGNAAEVAIGATYKVSVYAMKAGYENSDVAMLEFTLGSNSEICDVNQDGVVDVADIATIIDRMAGK